jgi:hypothetical protein
MVNKSSREWKWKLQVKSEMAEESFLGEVANFMCLTQTTIAILKFQSKKVF